MRFKDAGVVEVRVGLNRIGIVGLRGALKAAADSGLKDREAIVDLLVETLEPDNYISGKQVDDYRVALWREYLRSRGRDFSEFFSEIPVTIRGEAGKDRDRLEELLGPVFAEMELNPRVSFAGPVENEPNPQLVVNDETLVRGPVSRQDLKAALQKTLSHW